MLSSFLRVLGITYHPVICYAQFNSEGFERFVLTQPGEKLMPRWLCRDEVGFCVYQQSTQWGKHHRNTIKTRETNGKTITPFDFRHLSLILLRLKTFAVVEKLHGWPLKNYSDDFFTRCHSPWHNKCTSKRSRIDLTDLSCSDDNFGNFQNSQKIGNFTKSKNSLEDVLWFCAEIYLR